MEEHLGKKDILKSQQTILKEDIVRMLDSFLIGTVAKPPSMSGHNLTTKVAGKTVTLYVRKDIVAMAKEMSSRYKLLWQLMQKLSKVNWELLKLENE
jgi:adenosylmethionine-8-amino-7-oxononanoate aminotransferase